MDISRAFCSLSELFLTDLCDEADAEEQCEKLLGMALQYGSNSPEPYQALASVRISQRRNTEALELLQKSISLWHREMATDDNAEPADADVPSYDFREVTCQLLLELEQWALAAELLEELLEEDDEVPEVLYMAAFAYSRMDPPDVSAARMYLIDATRLLETMRAPDFAPLRLQIVELTAQLPATDPQPIVEQESNDDEADIIDGDGDEMHG